MDELLAQDHMCRIIGPLRTVAPSGPIGTEPGAREGAACDYVTVWGRAIHRWKALIE